MHPTVQRPPETRATALQATALDTATAPTEAGADARAPSLARDLLALTKPRLSSLVLFTSGGGLALAPVDVPAGQALAAIVGTTMVVAGANVLNCYLERDSDKDMARTASRPLPAGRMDPRVALVFGVSLSVVSVTMLSVAATPLAGLLAAIALLLYVLVYTPMKRTSSLSVLVGAVSGALPPVIGWAAATGTIDTAAVVLFGILFLWQVPHTLAIGMYRQAQYTRAGLVVHAAEFGHAATRARMLLYTLGLFPLPLLLLKLGYAGLPTAVTGSAIGAVLVYQAAEGWFNEGGARWARRFFLTTLVYLTGIFAALVVDLWV